MADKKRKESFCQDESDEIHEKIRELRGEISFIKGDDPSKARKYKIKKTLRDKLKSKKNEEKEFFEENPPEEVQVPQPIPVVEENVELEQKPSTVIQQEEPPIPEPVQEPEPEPVKEPEPEPVQEPEPEPVKEPEPEPVKEPEKKKR